MVAYPYVRRSTPASSAAEADLTAVARAEIDRTGIGLDRFDDGPLGGDEGPTPPGSKGDDLIYLWSIVKLPGHGLIRV